MSILNRLNVSASNIAGFTLSTFLIAACSNNSNASAPTQIPDFDGLQLIQPKFNAQALLQQSEALTTPLKQREQLLSSLETEEAAITQEIQTQNQRLKALESELDSINAKLKSTNQQLGESIRAGQPLYQLMGEFDTNRNHRLELSEINNFQYAQKFHPELQKEIATFNSQLRAIGVKIEEFQREYDRASYYEIIFTSKRKNLLAQISSERTQEVGLREQLATAVQKLNAAITADFEKLSVQIEQRPAKNPHLQAHEDLRAKLKDTENSRMDVIEKIRSLSNQQTRKRRELIEAKNSPSPIDAHMKLLVEQKASLIKRLESKEVLSIEEIASALIVKHIRDSKIENVDQTQVREILTDLAATAAGSDHRSLKVNYEKEISKKLHDGKTLVYNKAAVSIVDILKRNRMQCYSGTTLHLMINELLAQPNKYAVVILTSGHVLPGFIAIEKNQLTLFGIETTQSGKALINFGKTDDIAGAIRVFDARQFLFLELFKGEITNFQDIYTSMLATVAKYGFKTQDFEPMDHSMRVHASDQILNSSPVGFGIATVAEGDQIREESTEISLNLMYKRSLAQANGNPEGAIVNVYQMKEPYKSCEALATQLGYSRERLRESRGSQFRHEFCSHEGQIMPFEYFMMTIFEADLAFHEKCKNNTPEMLKTAPNMKCADDENNLIFYKDYLEKSQPQ
ncbi:MAG: hypothetical protein K2Q26_07120 [Bdellovibrionales bacterium]|nr:hypothetical protein [Bdellovibrionales bacterium]